MRHAAVELALAVLAGAAVMVGVRLGEYVVDPYNAPRLNLERVQAWLDPER